MGSGFSWSKILGQQIPSPLKKNGAEESAASEVEEREAPPVDAVEEETPAPKKWKGFSFEVEANEDSFSMTKVPTVGAAEMQIPPSSSHPEEEIPEVVNHSADEAEEAPKGESESIELAESDEPESETSLEPITLGVEEPVAVQEFQGLLSMPPKEATTDEVDPLERIRELQRQALADAQSDPEDTAFVQGTLANLGITSQNGSVLGSAVHETNHEGFAEPAESQPSEGPNSLVEANTPPASFLMNEDGDSEGAPSPIQPSNELEEASASQVYQMMAPPVVETWVPGEEGARSELEGPELEAAIEAIPEPELIDDDVASGNVEAQPESLDLPAADAIEDAHDDEELAAEVSPVEEPNTADPEWNATADGHLPEATDLVAPSPEGDQILGEADPTVEAELPVETESEQSADARIDDAAEMEADDFDPKFSAEEPAVVHSEDSEPPVDTAAVEMPSDEFELIAESPETVSEADEALEASDESEEVHAASTEMDLDEGQLVLNESDDLQANSDEPQDEPETAATESEAETIAESEVQEDVQAETEGVASNEGEPEPAEAMDLVSDSPEFSSEYSNSESEPELAAEVETEAEAKAEVAADVEVEAEAEAEFEPEATDGEVEAAESSPELNEVPVGELQALQVNAEAEPEAVELEAVLSEDSAHQGDWVAEDNSNLNSPMDEPKTDPAQEYHAEEVQAADESDAGLNTGLSEEAEMANESSEGVAEAQVPVEAAPAASTIPDVFARAMENAIPEALPVSQAPTKLRASGSPDFGDAFALDPRTGMPMSFNEVNLNMPMSFDEEEAAAAKAESDAKAKYKPGHVPASVHSIDVSDHRFDEPVEDGHENAYAEMEDATKVSECHIDDILRFAIEHKASDCHLTAGLPPMMRLDGEIAPMPFTPLGADETKKLIFETLTDEQLEKFETTHELDFAYTVRGLSRFRFNVFMQRGAVAGALRAIPTKIPSFETLGLPPVIRELSKRTSGLILVTGPTGSGKSTTIASMIDDINETRTSHIVTIEDPIEYLHRHKKCMVNQRELHSDTYTLHNALRAVLREDPDIILVGELRDLETIEAALTLAETGHLVFGTLHTRNAPASVDRVVDVFPSDQQAQIRVLLGNTLEGIVSQQLLPKLGGGRCAALEIMVATPAIKNLVREGKTHQMYSSIETGGQLGMQTMDSSLANFIRLGYCSYDECLMRAVDKETFARLAKVAA